MADITPPKKAAPAGHQLIIPTRPIMDTSDDNSSDAPTSAEQADTAKPPAPESTVVPSKRPVITPPKGLAPEDVKPTIAPQTATSHAPVPQTASAFEPQNAAAPPKADASEVVTDGAAPAVKNPTAETRKAVAEAEQATRRQEELEHYVNSRQFFVPVNSVARKRSIKVSILLTLLVLILAVLLIDLMLDSGIILLIQHIPHTHFFTSS